MEMRGISKNNNKNNAAKNKRHELKLVGKK